MDREEIEEYIKKLSLIEKELNDDDATDLEYIQQLDTILNNLRNDVMVSQQNVTPEATNHAALEIRFKKLHNKATTPTYSRHGDAGLDLVACEIKNETQEQITYGTGISMEIPYGYVGLVFPRSSIRKYDLDLTNSVGVIDSGYRGEIQATFNKTNMKTRIYEIGDRIAQILILPYPQVKFTQTEDLSITERGDGGFGSTGT